MATITDEDMVQTGPGTLAGRYLRMFWQPVQRVQDLSPGQAKPIRILGEDLTLYRGASGEAHAVAFRCAHRGTQLSTGWVEGDDLRCFYHGWKYGPDGQCIEQPAEPEPFCNRIKIRAYPTQEYLGLIFAYFGEGVERSAERPRDPASEHGIGDGRPTAPPLRRYPDYEQPGVLVAGPPEYWPCNFFNRLDNATDGAHVPWTHRESLRRVAEAAGEEPYNSGAVARVSEETEYGLRSGSVQHGVEVFQTHFHMPITNQTVSSRRVEGSMEDAVNLTPHRLFWRLPVDDDRCVSFVVDWIDLQGEEAERYLERRAQAEVAQDAFGGRSPVAGPGVESRDRFAPSLHDLSRDVLGGAVRMHDVDQHLSTYKLFWIEDYVAQCGQGPFADRSHEHLGRSDVGVSALRALWARELKALAEGRPLKEWRSPSGLIRRGSRVEPAPPLGVERGGGEDLLVG